MPIASHVLLKVSPLTRRAERSMKTHQKPGPASMLPAQVLVISLFASLPYKLGADVRCAVW